MKSALFCLLLLLAAQPAAPELEITAEPHHHLIFENKSVRVFYVEVPSNDATEMHWHRHDFIGINLDAVEMSNTVDGKPPVIVKVPAGEAHFTAAPFAHTVHPVAAQPIRNITIEILEDATLRNAPSKWDAAKTDAAKTDAAPTNPGKTDSGKPKEPSRTIVGGGSRRVLFVQDGIRVSESELLPGAVSPLHHHATPHMIVPLSEFDLRSDEEGKAPTTTHYKPGSAQWIEGGFSHTLTNSSANAAKYVTLEFP
jgi:hypothetical protein